MKGAGRGLAAMVPAGLIIGIGGLAFNVVVGRIAGVAAYGAVGTLLIAGVIGSISAQGAQYELAASVSRAGGAWRPRPHQLLHLVWPWLAVACLGLAAAGPLSRFLHLGSSLPVVVAIGLFVLTMLSALPQGVLVGGEWFVTVAAVGVTMTVVRIGLGICAALVLPPVSGFLLASLLATLAGGIAFVLAARICLRSRSARHEAPHPRQSAPGGVVRRGTTQLEHRGAPALQGGVLAVVIWVTVSVPLFAARHLTTSGITGRFAAAQALAMGILFVTAPITSAFYPSIARDRQSSPAWRGLACTIGLAAASTGGLVALGPMVIGLFYGPSFMSSRLLFAALGISASLAACLSFALWACGALGRRRAVSAVILLAGGAEALLATLWHPGPLALAIGPGLAVLSSAGFVGMLVLAATALSWHPAKQRPVEAGGPRLVEAGGPHTGGLPGPHTGGLPGPHTGGLPGPQPELVAPTSGVGLPITVGVMAYNEQDSVEAVIGAYLTQSSGVTRLAEIVVVASGCTDRTVERAQRAAATSDRVRVVVQPTREGKLAAVRSFLATADTDVVVIAGADTVPAPDLVETLGRRLAAEPLVGMVGGRIVPVVPAIGSFAERLNEVLWGLHHQVALRSPKLGEIVALRRSFISAGALPDGVNCDEVALEAAVISAGGALAYEPRAVVGNLGPRALGDYLSQRRRIRCQHLNAAAHLGYCPATASTKLAAAALLAHLRRRPQDLAAAIGAMAVEALACCLGQHDYRRGEEYRTWAPARSARPAPLGQVVAMAASKEKP